MCLNIVSSAQAKNVCFLSIFLHGFTAKTIIGIPMSHQLKTQCPSCGALYPMPAAKIGDPTARAKCGRCQQVFLLNENIKQPATTNTPNQNASPAQNVAVAPIRQANQAQTAQPQANNAGHSDNLMTRRPTPQSTPTTKPAPKTPVQQVATADHDDFSRYLEQQMNTATQNIPSNKPGSSTESETWVQDLLQNGDTGENADINRTTNPKANKAQDIDLTTVIPPAPFSGQKKNKSLKQVFSHKPTTQQLATRRPLVGQLMWLIGCLLLAGLLIVQYVLFNLDTLIKNPSHAQKIQAFCELAKCSAPNANLSSIGIESSHRSRKGETDIVITIFNRGSEEQLYPDLLVRLKTNDGRVVGDFVAGRRDYLAQSQKSILGHQSKRIMLTAKTDTAADLVEVTPIYFQEN